MYTIKTNILQLKNDNSNKRYKVLLNAGGGAFRYVITNLMSSLLEDVYQKIDVVGGTSIGGILTLLYSVNSDYKWINDLFLQGVGKIFKKRTLGGISGPLYNNTLLNNFISKVLKDYKLSDINKLNLKLLHVIVPTLDFSLSQPRVFDNIKLDLKLDMPLTKIALATSAAPTYFPAIEYLWRINNISLLLLMKRPINLQIYLVTKQFLDYKLRVKLIKYDDLKSVLIDGGVIENIPVITTYTTLRSKLGILAKDIDMFVIGTGNDYLPSKVTTKQMNKWSYIDWLTKFLIPYVTESNLLTSVYWGSLFGFNSFCYYNPLKVTGAMDDPKIIPTLKKQCLEIHEDFKKQLYLFLLK